MLAGLFGTEMPLIIQFCLVFLIVLGLIGATPWAVRRFSKGQLGAARPSGRQSRLSIIDSASLAGRRRLILIRRDNVEHLLMIGGPTDVIIEANIAHAVAVSHEVPETRSPAAAKPPLGAIPLPDKGSRPLLPKPASIPRPAPRIESSPEEPVLLVQSQARTLTRPHHDMLAVLADELSTRRPAPGKTPTAVTRPHATDTRAELEPEPRFKPQPEPQIEKPQPVETEPAAVEVAARADENVADMARRLKAALRKPDAAANARPSATPPRAAPSPEQAPAAAEAAPTATRPPGLSEPKRQRADDRTPYDDLERELARLIGRTPNK